VVDLSFYEEEIFPDTSQDEEFAQRLFAELNRELLGPPDDGNIIILSDSDEEEEVHEEITADTDDAPDGMQDDNSDGGDKVDSP
jgi:hypothetical protein